jgi:hypothetical protein
MSKRATACAAVSRRLRTIVPKDNTAIIAVRRERGLEWRCTDRLSLREFLRLSEREGVPDHSWLSRTRSRLPIEVHDQVFTWVLERPATHGLIKGERIGVDASTMEATQRCARSFGAAVAKAIARCWRVWPTVAADQGDTATMPDTLANAIEHLTAVDAARTPEAPAELIADKGYHSRNALKALDGGPWKSRICETAPRRVLTLARRWCGASRSGWLSLILAALPERILIKLASPCFHADFDIYLRAIL